MRPVFTVFILFTLQLLCCCLAAPPQFSALAQQYADAPLVSYDITQDQQGYIWFASELDGLQRFDGYELEPWPVLRKQEKNPTFANVNQLLIDSEQRLWVSTWGQGVTLLDQHNQVQLRFTSTAAPAQRLPSDRVQSFFEDSQQRIWIGAVEGLRYVQAAQPSVMQQVDALKNVRVWQLSESADGVLWLATSKGLFRLSADLKEHQYWTLDTINGGMSSAVSNEIRTLLLVEQGLWLGTQFGLFFFSFERSEIQSRYPAELGSINALFSPQPGRLWVGSSSGLFQINTDDKSQPRPDYFLQTADIRKLFRDKTGVIWVATRNRGIYKVNPLQHKVRYLPLPLEAGMPDNALRRIYSQTIVDNRIWLGLDQDIFSYDLQTELWKKHSLETNRQHHQVSGIVKDTDGVYWAGTDIGLFHAQGKDDTFLQDKLPATIANFTSVTALATDPDGTLWLGLWEKGLVKWDKKNPLGTLEQHDIATQPGDAIISIDSEDPEFLWLVSRFSGLYQLQRNTGLITRYHSGADSLIQLPSDTLLCLEKASAYQFWLCTNQGLFFMDLEKKSGTLYQSQQGLPDNRVIAIQAHQNGTVWVSTKKGLAVMDLARQSFKILGEKANITSMLLETRALQSTASGDIWLGTAAGLYNFKPDDIQQHKFNAPLVISKVKAGVQQWFHPVTSAQTPLELAPPAKEISIYFSFLEYYFTEGHQYQYRLSGAGTDQEWHYIGHKNHISFTHLPAGQYSFEVRNALEPTEIATARLDFVIPTPLWQDKRLWLFSCLIASLLLWLFWQSRVRNLHQQNIRLNQLVQQRTEALEQANSALLQQARTDFLTRLPNRLAFSEQFELLQRQAIRQKLPFTLALLDIDHFKSINDTYGHDAGDVVLTKVAQTLSQRLRQRDVLARWGGEEFILLLPETTTEGAFIVCEELRQSLMQLVIEYDHKQITVTATLGLAQLDDVQLELVRWQSAADIALYQGKKTGRNKVVLYQGDAAVID